MIRAQGISKRFGPVEAVSDIHLDILEGEIFGLIGPDGAGKTTLIRILTSLMRPDTGTATVAGCDTVADYRRLRTLFGYMPGRFSLYQDLSIEENIAFFASVFGADLGRAYERIRDIYIQIEPFKNRRAGQLSGGMKQKLALCCALIHEPRLLFLDEPTTGVDAVSRREFWDMLSRFKARGLTMLVSTPYMDEASRCDRIAFMKGGRILLTDAPAEMGRHFRHDLWSVEPPDRNTYLDEILRTEGVHSAWSFGRTVHVATRAGVTVPDGVRIEPGIEDVFMELSR
jgi:ABC-2 type transport system ATP-binding protein